MNPLRVVINVILGLGLAAGGVYLLGQDRWVWGAGDDALIFTDTGVSLLAVGALFLALFTAAITQAWVRGTVPMPSPGDAHPHPAYRGSLMLRYWYLVGPGLACVLAAILMAGRP